MRQSKHVRCWPSLGECGTCHVTDNHCIWSDACQLSAKHCKCVAVAESPQTKAWHGERHGGFWLSLCHFCADVCIHLLPVRQKGGPLQSITTASSVCRSLDGDGSGIITVQELQEALVGLADAAMTGRMG